MLHLAAHTLLNVDKYAVSKIMYTSNATRIVATHNDKPRSDDATLVPVKT
jgi:hypothetical protein